MTLSAIFGSLYFRTNMQYYVPPRCTAWRILFNLMLAFITGALSGSGMALRFVHCAARPRGQYLYATTFLQRPHDGKNMVDRHWFPTSRRLHRSFHSTTNLFGKNRNGGRGRPKQKSTLSKRKPRADGSFVGDDDAETDVLREFNDTFATSYHAPVMPSECVDALLKQGVFADIIRDRKDRWRKKRNNIYAKRRKAGYHVNAAESCDFDGEVNRDEARTPRLFIDGTLGGGVSQLVIYDIHSTDKFFDEGALVCIIAAAQRKRCLDKL